MNISIKEIVAGRKTFFIAPDISLFPENFLEEYFALGYECYFIENDKQIDLKKKLEVLINIFHDVLFFINIDSNIPGIDWVNFIKEILLKYHNQACIGVLYTKRQTKDDRIKLEHKYLRELGLVCGCVQLEYQKNVNFGIIEKVLFANQAQGRRKTIRALCTRVCTFSFNLENVPYTGVLQDISLSHFSFVFPVDKLKVKLYEKVTDFHFNIKGFLFRSDAILIMERNVEDGMLYVFSFVTESGANGLYQRIKQLLIPNIYQIMSNNCKNLLEQVFQKVKAEQLENGEELSGIDEEI